MGAFWSFARGQADTSSPLPLAPPLQSIKRQRRLSMTDLSTENPQLIPGIPDELSLRILARIPRSSHFRLGLVCRHWRDAFARREIFDIRKQLNITEEWLYVLTRDENESLSWHALDPASGRWQPLPPMPEAILEEESGPLDSVHSWWGFSSAKLSELLRGLFQHKDPIEKSPFCGCAAGALDGYLYVVGGFSKACATRSMWRYDPCMNRWNEAAALGTARAYCKTALLHNKLYVIGGVNRSDGGGLTPLQSAEVYEPTANAWRPIPSMPFAKAQDLPSAFFADMLKPIATGMASYQDKLCVPQSLYSWPFFVDVGGEVFDPASNTWVEMPRGMGEEWPARQAGTKLSAVVNGSLYALDPMSSLDGSKVKVYDSEADAWKVVLKKVPVLFGLSDSECPYLLACLWNRLHVITKDINNNIIVVRPDIHETPIMTSSSSTISCESSSEAKSDGWKTIASKSFGQAELVTCQVLAI